MSKYDFTKVNHIIYIPRKKFLNLSYEGQIQRIQLMQNITFPIIFHYKIGTLHPIII